ncbi:ATP-binding protein [Intestinimonas sp. MSJ-38]|uniref:ATP-binding protein n=1 Tax=Intestinimonas sp. MSJ-38 TaxID=2841532 RepID=UPI001C115711|nr:ATP-binding protein [Intestinimonas sp. MSJ-38]MBU5431183.1 cell wall metabolism sensor histidine kinase WalK [Intestinimonas sp. MSJ-38]
MLKSLQMKLVLILMLLVVAVMAVVGVFLVNSVTAYNRSDFQRQMVDFFALRGEELDKGLSACNGDLDQMEKVLEAYNGGLGLDDHRNFYILDGKTGEFLTSSESRDATPFRELTPNMITAMEGEVGQTITALSPYFDVALPVDGGNYVLAVVDDKGELDELTWTMFTILIRSLMFGLAVTILLSFILARTITNPVQRLTRTAQRIAAGDFSQQPQAESADEIGNLTRTFGEMAKVLENTLAEVNGERNKLSTLFTYMADGVVAFDKSGHILHMNPAAQQMLGMEFGPELIYTQVFPNLNVEESDLGEGGRYIEIDYAANKRILKILLAMFGTAEDENSGIMAVLHDITEQKKLDSSRREFVANVSHELRTPLTNVKGYTETLLDAGDELDGETRRNFLQVIYNESDRMTHIVKDLLTLSQLDYGKMDMEMSPIPVKLIVQNIASAMLIEARGQGLTLETKLEEPLPLILADRNRMEQVIANIVSNAIKYNRPGGTVTLSAFSQEDKVVIKVQDTGIGIPQEDIPRLFERFYRVDKARSRERGGTGLGLAIAKEIVEQHQGTIGVESQLDAGTTVTITLPVCPPDHEGQL